MKKYEAVSGGVRVLKVIEAHIERRGGGKSQDSPVRIITQYFSLDGQLLAEVDPCAPERGLENLKVLA